ncbi:cytochrome P450 [Stenotrophomonas sp. YAU14A_MKIMI4_1]|uniref:cytochrome P450 n=1 Tax=Stenotrophomonas sp. YAU14A_MKIMI4_1 TaxID=2072408 RepID=UPI000D542886|nr:cytochrome P450 [Stenotrophomonas sp. YAU14A_MKIMI4_1]AWH29583.1 cytochrome [Stenotrophomonas sp. YAU14A_MKIMI4_1]
MLSADKDTGFGRGKIPCPLSMLVVPDIDFPFDKAVERPDSKALQLHVLDWGQRHGLIGRRGAHRLRTTPLLELGTALCGQAPSERAQVLLCWYLWALTLDDRIDDGPWAENGVLERFITEIEAITCSDNASLRQPHATDDPMLAVFAGHLWPLTRDWSNALWQSRLREHLILHLRAQAALVRARQDEATICLDDYLPLRRHSFGALFFFDLVDAAESVDPFTHPASAASWASLREMAADIIAWTNDIHSIAKDVVCGERCNLVSILAERSNDDWSGAIESAHRMVQTSVAEFAAAATALESTGATPASSPDRLRNIVRASADWHRRVSRYHLRSTDAQAAFPGSVDLRQAPPTLKSRQFEIDPYPLYEQLRKALPIVYDEPTDVWLVSKHIDVKAALTHPGVSSRNYNWQIGPLLGHTLVAMDGCEHAAHRALLSPAFRAKAMVVLEQSIVSVASDLLAALAGRPRAELVSEFTAALPVRVMAGALGLPADTPAEVARLKDWCAIGFAYMGNYRQDPALLTGGLSNRDSFYDFIQPHIDARKIKPADDLISLLLAAKIDDQPLPESFVRAYCAILMTAGSETSHGALANLIVNLLSEPGLKRAVLANPGLMDSALTETLRRNPPLQLLLRETTEALELPSGTIPAQSTFACLIGSANRDPEQFERPDAFDIARTNQATSHFAFGAGRHFCLGSILARKEITIGANMLLKAFPNLRWAPGFQPTERGFLNRCPDRLEVQL